MRVASTNSQEERQNKEQRKIKRYMRCIENSMTTHTVQKKKDQDDSNDAMV